MKAIIEFEKVKKDDNRTIMLGAERIGVSDSDIEVYQSVNKNVITIVDGDYYYHTTIEKILNGILGTEGK